LPILAEQYDQTIFKLHEFVAGTKAILKENLMPKTRLITFGLTGLLLLLLAGGAGATTLANFAINWQVLNGGGAPASAGNITLNGSLGQTFIGQASNGNIGLGSGYWYGASLLTVVGSVEPETPAGDGAGPESNSPATLYLPLLTK
jgi:hypothetical protein